MPRKGYDVTGCAPGTPAAEAAARASERNAAGNRTPRAGTPVDPSRHDGDERNTPRASRTGISIEFAPGGLPEYSQVNVMQDDRGFQIQRRLPRQELYQNPLNMNSIQAANSLMARPINGPHGHPTPSQAHSSMFLGVGPSASTRQGAGYVNTPAQFNVDSFGVADFGAQQQQQLWNNNQFYALPARQHGIQSIPMAQPAPESFASYQTAAGTAQNLAFNTNTGASASKSAEGDTEMTDVDR